MIKLLTLFYSLFFIFLSCNLKAEYINTKSFHKSCNGRHETWYIGSNEKAFKYTQHVKDQINDSGGLFIAINDGGPYDGYSYYEIRVRTHTWPKAEGGPAYLPPNPRDFPMNGDYPVARINSCSGPNIQPHPDSLVVSDNGQLPELPKEKIVPIGSKFFYWLSNRGFFVLCSCSEHRFPSQRIDVKSRSVPKPEYAKWFLPSNPKEQTFTFMLD